MNTANPDFDVAVIGGGPAGSTIAALLARKGVKVGIFERELFPRPHVGESLVPAANRVLAELGILEAINEAGFPRKFGAVWTTRESKKVGQHGWSSEDFAPSDVAAIQFAERPQEGVVFDYTFHVDRGKFDLMLLQHAHSLGSEVIEGVRVRGVDFDGPFPEVHYNLGRKQMSSSARIIVDASGRHTLLGNQLKHKINDPIFNQYAIHTWFEGYDRLKMAESAEFNDHIFIHFLPINNSWVWQIPITESITSIGVVTQRQNFAKSKASREQFFWEAVASRPEVHDALRAANQLRPLKDEGDYSYSMRQICGDGYVMIGDAARFVDPIFSSGVSIALNSARFASFDVLASLEAGDTSGSRFQEYADVMRRGAKNWYEFIAMYYRLNILFTFFVNSKRYRNDVLKLLQGDVYDESEPEALTAMRQAVETVENDVNHPWHALLNDLTARSMRPQSSS